ncbi:putative flagellin domain-containing protein [Magnetofaba australis IT-1]|uniref:Flagellin n=1 Tax=Magnetofaba australis IT-1 TaxID=1434232 RepID=A0A1Y2K663_9PROT|nr:putative flagellin domain-containing protein [Magnetofaba australis IT-1]
MRINSAADDAGGLGIATNMTAQIRGLNQAISNANDGISMAQVAEGALNETDDALQRIRELAVQSANGSLSTTDRQNLQVEVSALISEIQRIATSTEYNGSTLMSTEGTSVTFFVGANQSQTISLTIKGARTTDLGISLVSIGTSASWASSAITLVDTALYSVSEIRATLGAVQNRLDMVTSVLATTAQNLTEARSNIMDANVAAETTNLTRSAIIQQAGVAVLAQANQQPSVVLSLLG